MKDDIEPPWAGVILLTLLVAVVLAVLMWRTLDWVNSPAITTTTTSIQPSTSRTHS